MQRSKRSSNRVGAVAPLVLILLIPLLAMVAFAVDTGYVCVVKAELQNAADSAALAGASQLLFAEVAAGEADGSADTGGGTSGGDTGGGKGKGKGKGGPFAPISMMSEFSGSSSPDATEAIAAAKSEAKKYSKHNYGGSVALDLKDSDIVVGYQATTTSALRTYSGIGDDYPNAVQVTLRRDRTANNPLPLFVAPVIGISNWSGTATATAMVRSDMRQITGFKSWPGGPNGTLLPITIHVDSWNNFIKSGKSPDGITHDDFKVKVPLNSGNPKGNVSSGVSDGTPEIAGVYPDRTTPGNWGLIKLDPTASPSATNMERWILDGPTPSELGKFGPDGLQATVSEPATVPGGPGLKSSLVPDFEAIIGQPRSIPLYTEYSGNGNNTAYKIVGFAGITVVKAEGRGSNIEISFQPVITIDPTATPGSSETNISKFVYADSPVVLTR